MTQPAAIPELSTAVVDTSVSPTVTRIGVVKAVQEATDITVAISGSDVLVQAAYLFPTYQPLLGDRVVVQRQGAAWFVLGTLSGPINTALANPSFEEGAVGATPPSWSLNVISTGAGTPTFLTSNNFGIQGPRTADFGTDSVTAGESQADVFSAAVACPQDSKWTAALYLTIYTEPSLNDFSDIELWIQFLDSASTVISQTMVATQSWSVDQILPYYFRLDTDIIPARYVSAPLGAAFVRMKIHGRFGLAATSFFSFFLDYMILRQV